MDGISKYHRRYYVGCEENNGYRMSWDSSHPELEPTETFSIGYGAEYCVYCCKKAYPIQAGLRNGGENYATTGHTCVCDEAENEKLKRVELKELRDKHEGEERELHKKFNGLLIHDKRKRLEMKHAHEVKELEREMERESWRLNVSINSN